MRREGCNVSISVLCPGPVHTEFGDVARVNFGLGNEKGKKFIVLTSKDVAEYAIKKMFNKKLIIVPGFSIKMGIFFQRFVPTKLLLKISYNIQRSKG